MCFTNAATSLRAMFSTPAPFTVWGNATLSRNGTCSDWSGNARRWLAVTTVGSLFEPNELAIMALCIGHMALLDVSTRCAVDDSSTLTIATSCPSLP